MLRLRNESNGAKVIITRNDMSAGGIDDGHAARNPQAPALPVNTGRADATHSLAPQARSSSGREVHRGAAGSGRRATRSAGILRAFWNGCGHADKAEGSCGFDK